MIVYKIFEKHEKGYKNLFHERRNIYSLGDDVTATVKMVYEAYDQKTHEKIMYVSGIHVILTYDLCKKYLRRFKNQNNKIIVTCETNINDLRPKPNGRKGVCLTTKINLIKEA